MSRLTTHTLDTVSHDVRAILEDVAAASLTSSGRLLNLHAQMATAPAVLAAYAGIRQATDDHGTLDFRARSAIMLTTSTADGCEYGQALMSVLARRAGWNDEQVDALRSGQSVGDERLDTLLDVVREAASNKGRVEDATWKTALGASWVEEELVEAFVHLGLTVFVDYFLHYAKTALDVPTSFDRT